MPAERSPNGLVRTIGRAFGRVIVAAWLAVGLILATVLVLEAAARWIAPDAEAAGASGSVSPPDRLAEIRRDQAQRATVVDSYRGEWSLPLRTRFVNVDSAGRRVTPQPTPDPAAGLVLMLGGSEMWGANASDSATIPALVAASLRAHGADLSVLNLAQPGFTAMQGAMTLLVELALGAQPRVVVALDGYAEVAVPAQVGEPGRTMHEADYQRRLDLGQRGFSAELLGLPRHSTVLAPLLGHRGSSAARAAEPALCPSVARHYGNVTAELEGLARTFGFELLVFLAPPPASATTTAPGLIARCFAAIDSTMLGRPAFVALTDPREAQPAVGPDGALVAEPGAYPAIAERIASAILTSVRAADSSAAGGR